MAPPTLALLVAAALLAPQSADGPDAIELVLCAGLLDDDTLLLGRSDGAIVAVDPATGADEENSTFARHTSGVTDLAVDPKGEFVAAASRGGVVALWQVDVAHRNGRGYPGRFASPAIEITPTPKPWHESVQIEWTADGSHLVTWSYDWLHGESPTTTQVWTRAGELVWTGPKARQVDVHPTERRIAAVVEDAVLLGWPGEDLREIELEHAYDAVEFSPDGASLAVGGRDFHVWILDAESGEVARSRRVVDADPFQIHGYMQRLRWSPDGEHIGVVAAKGLIPAIVTAKDLRAVWAPGLYGGRMWSIFDLAWTPGGSLVTGFGEVHIVDPATGETIEIVQDAEWQELLQLEGTDDYLLVAGSVARRHAAGDGEVVWRRQELPHGKGKATSPTGSK